MDASSSGSATPTIRKAFEWPRIDRLRNSGARPSPKGMLQTIYRAAAGAFIAFCVAMQYWLLVRGETFAGMAASSLRFFSFFTILTNILAAATLLLPLIAPRSTAGQFLARPAVRTAVTAYIITVGVIYLPAAQRPQPAPGLADVLRGHAALRDTAAIRARLAGVRRQAQSQLAAGLRGAGLSDRLYCLDACPRRRVGLVPIPVPRRRRTRLPARVSSISSGWRWLSSRSWRLWSDWAACSTAAIPWPDESDPSYFASIFTAGVSMTRPCLEFS